MLLHIACWQRYARREEMRNRFAFSYDARHAWAAKKTAAVHVPANETTCRTNEIATAAVRSAAERLSGTRRITTRGKISSKLAKHAAKEKKHCAPVNSAFISNGGAG